MEKISLEKPLTMASASALTPKAMSRMRLSSISGSSPSGGYGILAGTRSFVAPQLSAGVMRYPDNMSQLRGRR